jgi:hypothetical protein
MKWLPRAGTTQRSDDGRYVIVLDKGEWIAYQLHSTIAKRLGARDTDVKARALCIAHEAQLTAAHRRSA